MAIKEIVLGRNKRQRDMDWAEELSQDLPENRCVYTNTKPEIGLTIDVFGCSFEGEEFRYQIGAIARILPLPWALPFPAESWELVTDVTGNNYAVCYEKGN